MGPVEQAVRKPFRTPVTLSTYGQHKPFELESLTMTGHVLTHVPADPDGFWINRGAARVLNAEDNEVLRCPSPTTAKPQTSSSDTVPDRSRHNSPYRKCHRHAAIAAYDVMMEPMTSHASAVPR